ncbi:MAG: tetraacyldisaccharide 4'-kinase [Pseudomonadota bacterium]
MRVESALNRVWYPSDQATPARRVLAGAYRLLTTPLEWLFRAIVAARYRAYRNGSLCAQRVGVPVVVIGNLTVGGTGKTPFTCYLARCLAEDAGLRVGIVTRGYGAQREDGVTPVRVDASSDAHEVGDEPVLLATLSGSAVMAGRNRVAAARALAEEVDVLLADDGLQHLRLARDLEIVLLDLQRGVGNGRLLPCGPLREPPSRLRDVDALVLTGAASPSRAADSVAGALPPGAPTPLRAAVSLTTAYAIASPDHECALSRFAGAPVHAVAGIADPARFFALLRRSGLEIIEHPLADHALLDAKTIAFDDEIPVLMTEKDAVKCRSFADARCWAVRLDVQMAPEARKALVASVVALCAQGALNGS